MSSEAIRFLKKDPIMRNIIKQVGDYTLSRKNHHFSVLIRSIISQQLAAKAANTIFQRFRDMYPKFPTAQEILSTKKSDLRSIGLSNMKIEYLRDLARSIHGGNLVFESLKTMDDEQIISELTKVKGIGRWTAQMFLIFSLGRQDIFPVDDLVLKKAIQKAFFLKELPRSKQAEDLGERWRPYRTVATWYLWESFESLGNNK